MVWFDVQDLIDYARVMSRPTGIQRVCLELYAAMRQHAPARVGFVRHDEYGRGFRQVSWAEIEALWPRATVAVPPTGTADAMQPQAAHPPRGPVRRALRWLAWRMPPELRYAVGDACHGQIAVLRHLAQGGRALVPRPDLGARARHPTLDEVAQPGDVLASFGSPWSHRDYAGMVRRATGPAGLRFAMLVYDLIPVLHPEFYEAANGALFHRYMQSCLPLASHVLAISGATARDVATWSVREGIRLQQQPRAIPMGTGFNNGAAATDLPEGLEPGGYALLVATIEARKNHIVAFRAWRRLLEDLPRGKVPTLVFAGRAGWMVADLMQQMQNARYLGGKLLTIDSPDDATLAALYRGARFTLFPSLYEGWGLPVSESLGFGKVCLASSSTSIPEAGGPFCLYHDPDSVTDATRLYRRAIEEPGLIESLEQRIAAEYRPTPWTASAEAVLHALDG